MHPSRFREELKHFDRQLDLEWNGAKMQWEVVGVDRRNRKYLIKRFPLGTIQTAGLHTLQELYDVSPIKQGGAKELNRRIDRIREEEDAADERALQASIEDKIDEAWQRYQYAMGRRVSFASNSSPSKKEEVIITDRRRVKDDGKGEIK